MSSGSTGAQSRLYRALSILQHFATPIRHQGSARERWCTAPRFSFNKTSQYRRRGEVWCWSSHSNGAWRMVDSSWIGWIWTCGCRRNGLEIFWVCEGSLGVGAQKLPWFCRINFDSPMADHVAYEFGLRSQCLRGRNCMCRPYKVYGYLGD